MVWMSKPFFIYRDICQKYSLKHQLDIFNKAVIPFCQFWWMNLSFFISAIALNAKEEDSLFPQTDTFNFSDYK